MPFISLILAFIFLAIIFRNDRREYPAFSARLWLPILWLLLISTRLLEIVLRTQSVFNAPDAVEAAIQGNAVGMLVSLALIGLGLLTLLKSRFKLREIIKDNSWLFILYLYALISIVWADYQEVSLKRWVRICGSLIMVLLILINDDFKEALEHVIRRYAFICLSLSVILLKFYPSIGFPTGVMGTRVWAGVAYHKNELAIICAISLLFFIWRILKSRPALNRYDVIPVIISAYLIIRARSATANIEVIVGLFLILSMTLLKNNLKKVMMFTIIVSFISFMVVAIFQKDTDTAGYLYRVAGRDSTLTGRVPMWQYLIELGGKNLIGGSGYESFWLKNLEKIWARFAFGPNNAHNGYVDILLNLGIIGLVLLIVVIAKSLARLGTMEKVASNHGRILFVFFIIILLRNITESSMMNLSLSWFLFLLCSINVEGPMLPLAKS